MDVADWLRALGLEQYEAAFRENGVRAEVLCHLTADDLKELGVVAVGHRRELLVAIAKLRDEATSLHPIGSAVDQRTSTFAAERRQITVLFCDIVGSTPLSIGLDPEELRELLTAYQRNVGAAVTGERGYIARFVGDGVLAYFGWPNVDESHAGSAVRAGLAIIEAVGPQQLSVRIGIATGLVVTGDLVGVGAAQTMTAVGETPNLAARLQGLAQPNTIVVSEATRLQLGHLFELEDLGFVALKGFDAPVRPSRVLRKTAAVSHSEVVYANVLTPLVDRQEELGLLLRQWQEAKAGEGRVVLLSGEAGIGKSRLLAALEERLTGERHSSLHYFSSPHPQDSPFYPIIARLERDAGFIRGDTAEGRLVKLEAVLAPTAPSPEDIALLAALLSIPTDGRYPALELNSQQRKKRTLTAFLHRLSGMAHRKPVLMLFEDAHWSDPSSVELLEAVIEQVPELPVLLVVSFRPEFVAPWFGRPRVSLMALSRLDRRDATALAAQVVKSQVLSSQLLDRIVLQSDGVPLFIEELTKTVLEASVSGTAGATLAVPDTLQASLMARLDRLPAAKTVAQIGSVIGREFPHSLLEAVAGLQDAQLMEGLNELAVAGLVFRRGVPPDAVYMFKHALVQDVAYTSLLKGKRQELHCHIAETLEKAFPDTAETQPDLIAHHCTLGGLAGRAVHWWRAAGGQAIRRSANVEAVAHLRRALELISSETAGPERDLRELEVRIELGGPLMGTKGYGAPELEENYTRAWILCESMGAKRQIFPVLWGQFVIATNRVEGSLVVAQEMAARFLHLAQQQGDVGLEAIGHRIVGVTLVSVGQFDAGRDHLERAVELYGSEDRGLEDTYGIHPRISALANLCLALQYLGYLDRASRTADQALDEARRLGQFNTLGVVLHLTGRLRAFRRESQLVRETAAELIALSRRHGSTDWELVGEILMGWQEAQQEASEHGLQRMRQGIEGLRVGRSNVWLPAYLLLLAEVESRGGTQAEALRLLDEAEALITEQGQPVCEAEIHRLRATALLERGAADSLVEAGYERAISVARGQSARFWELRAAVSLARLWRDQGNRAEARDLLAPIYNSFTEGFDALDLKDAKALLDELA
jgi:class 3 adenylate cyclase/predicted ATPase